MADPVENLSSSAVTDAVDARHWRVMLRRLRATFTGPDFASGAAFVARIAEIADGLDHHPDVLLRWGQVTVTTSSHDVDGLTQRDIDLAAAVSEVADELGLTGAVPRSEMLEIAVDALDIPRVRPFWGAVLAYDEARLAPFGSPEVADEEKYTELRDPAGVGPTVWFQQMDEPREQRNRIHVDIAVPHDQAEARVQAAVAAGGHLVSDSSAPAFWIVADVEGNEVCVCTWQGRSSS
ncbi:4a-hydroxytetrahydrobiopterin dehydratase [Cellulomonas rhizosphaerae]|uniref:Putative pterin-4-alpha-carbinolamine dehydratase n=1 Tax=Cellulomonas rhizosphaerae TaxID=2293719 RepID=A0A413RIT5_9CELL|nr:4a-hydroxytetrahydrobiopterin dehydratase [Cellulomonas rhizosphaerae]RHA38310.1 4a-hydroxytetrahydrobiopterin dehydratase [Cellulomonas rhizosphaerae]